MSFRVTVPASVPPELHDHSDFCPECGENGIIIVDEARGERSCCSCGLVVEQVFSSGPEWRAYNASEEASRARASTPSFLSEEFTQQTEIPYSRTDAFGRVISPERRFEFSRLANLDKRAIYSETRNLRTALRELKRLKSQLDISDSVTKTAAIIYRKSLKANLVRGRSIDGIIAASLYLACRRESVPITLKDIQSRASISSKELGRCVRILLLQLKLTKLTHADPVSFVHRLADCLNITMATRNVACTIVDRAKGASLTVGKNPMSVAAAALYIAGVQTGERRTQAQMAGAARTTPVTIRNRFKELLDVLQIDLEIKRGAAAVPVYIEDRVAFACTVLN